jgi:hypothetical protein
MRKGIPLGRIAETVDMIGPALFLACLASDFITGQTLAIRQIARPGFRGRPACLQEA